MTKSIHDRQFLQQMQNTDTFKNCPEFKQKILQKTEYVQRMRDYFEQAKRYGYDYIRQNTNLTTTDLAILKEML